MDRYTVKAQGGDYHLRPGAELGQALGRLGRLEDLAEGIDRDLQESSAALEEFSREGRTKTASFRQLFTHKLLLAAFKDRLRACLTAHPPDSSPRDSSRRGANAS